MDTNTVEEQLREFTEGRGRYSRLAAASLTEGKAVTLPEASPASASCSSGEQPSVRQSGLENLVVAAKAQGVAVREIAALVAVSEETVRNILSTDRARKRLVDYLTKSGRTAQLAFLDGEAISSLAQLSLLRDDPKTPTTSRVKCCEVLINRAWGMPLQRVEHGDALPEDAKELDNEIEALQAKVGKTKLN